MPQTPDRRPGVSDEEGLNLESTGIATGAGQVRYTGTRFSLFDGVGEFDPRTGGSGITETQHKALRQLIHLADGGGPFEGFASGAYMELLPAADPFPTSAIWWESAAKLKKIVEQTVTYNPNKTIATEQWKAYDTDGSTVLATVTDTIAYSGVFEISRTRTIA